MIVSYFNNILGFNKRYWYLATFIHQNGTFFYTTMNFNKDNVPFAALRSAVQQAGHKEKEVIILSVSYLGYMSIKEFYNNEIPHNQESK